MSARFVSVEEAAQVLGIGRRTAYDLIARGDFPVPVQKVGAKLKVSTARLDQLLGVQQERAS